MKIYHYDPDTKELLGESEASLDPLETQQQGKDVFLIPANATDKKPPTIGVNQQATFDGSKWNLVKDFRGEKYYLTDGTEMIIENLDEEIPVDAPTVGPVGMFKPEWDGSKWVETGFVSNDGQGFNTKEELKNHLAEKLAEKQAKIDAAEKLITAGTDISAKKAEYEAELSQQKQEFDSISVTI